MADGGRTSQVVGARLPACVQANSPTTGDAIVVDVEVDVDVVVDVDVDVDVDVEVEVEVDELELLAVVDAGLTDVLAGRDAASRLATGVSLTEAAESISVAQPVAASNSTTTSPASVHSVVPCC
jgi:hypothetical protein